MVHQGLGPDKITEGTAYWDQYFECKNWLEIVSLMGKWNKAEIVIEELDYLALNVQKIIIN